MKTKQTLFTKPIAFFKRDFKTATSYRLHFATQGVGIILTTFSFFLLSKMFAGNQISPLEPYGGDYFSFVLIGIALADFFTISTNSFSNEIRTSQMIGTLESLLVTPTSIVTILLSSYVFKLFSTSFRIFFYLFVGYFVFDMLLQPVNFFVLLIVFTLTLLPYFGLGLVSASFIIVFKQGNPIGGLLAMSSGLLGGVMYPVSILPAWLKPFSAILPITHGLEAMRQVLLNGVGIGAIRNQLVILSILSIISLAAGLVSIYYGVKIAKKEGSLLLY
jgi:ABC-2 type transport system permease protein